MGVLKENALEWLYDKYKIDQKDFKKDFDCLCSANSEIEKLWDKNFSRFGKMNKKIKYVLLGEAPLWGEAESFFYNPKTGQTQFFYFKDLRKVIEKGRTEKKDLLDSCLECGIIVVDLFPYAFNSKTKFSYKNLGANDYRKLFEMSYESHLKLKIKRILENTGHDKLFWFYRYKRVEKAIHSCLQEKLELLGLSKKNYWGCISKKDGGIDRVKFGEIINCK